MAFSANLTIYKNQLRQQSYLHLENILSSKFRAILEDYRTKIATKRIPEIAEWHIPGKKRQFLFDFPSPEFLGQFLRGMGQITGDASEDITIGERHIKVYLDEAPQLPAPHIDRQAASFTVGFPIIIPEASRVCFFPHLSRSENTGDRAKYASLPPGTDMEAYYGDPRIARYRGKLGDMFIFHGSTIYHERIHPAGSVILYLKINAQGRDPLGENRSLLQAITPTTAHAIHADA